MATTKLREKMIRDLEIRRYSDKTIKAYLMGVSKLARHYNKSPDKITTEEILAFQQYLVRVKKTSWSNFNQTVCGIKFLFNITLKKKETIKHIPFQHKKKLFLSFYLAMK